MENELDLERKRLENNRKMLKNMIYSGLYDDVLQEYISLVVNKLDQYHCGVSQLSAEPYVKVSDLEKAVELSRR